MAKQAKQSPSKATDSAFLAGDSKVASIGAKLSKLVAGIMPAKNAYSKARENLAATFGVKTTTRRNVILALGGMCAAVFASLKSHGVTVSKARAFRGHLNTALAVKLTEAQRAAISGDVSRVCAVCFTFPNIMRAWASGSYATPIDAAYSQYRGTQTLEGDALAKRAASIRDAAGRNFPALLSALNALAGGRIVRASTKGRRAA